MNSVSTLNTEVLKFTERKQKNNMNITIMLYNMIGTGATPQSAQLLYRQTDFSSHTA